MAYQSLPSRDDVGITEERTQAATFLFDGTMQAADILLDMKVGISFCLQGMMLFGPLLLIIPVASGFVCFVYKRWSWELAPLDHTDAAGKETLFYFQAKNRKGEKRPGWMKALLQMLQVEGVVTAYKAFRDPLLYRQDWTVDKAFNGLIENFPVLFDPKLRLPVHGTDQQVVNAPGHDHTNHVDHDFLLYHVFSNAFNFIGAFA